MKVYIVTSGMYSGYGIDAVFTTEEKARAYAFAHEADVEEWEADIEHNYPPGMKPFYAWIDMRTGDASASPGEPDLPESVVVRKDGGEPSVYALSIHTWARDKDHAEKIAIEKRQEKLREAGL